MNNLPPVAAFDPYGHGLASGSADLFAPFLGNPRVAEVNQHSLRNTARWNMRNLLNTYFRGLFTLTNISRSGELSRLVAVLARHR